MNTAAWIARRWWRFAILLAAISSATLVTGAYLAQAKLVQVQQEAFAGRFVLAAERAAQAAENALALGVPLAPDTPLADLLQREALALAPALRSFRIESAAAVVLLQATAGAAAEDSQALATVQEAVHNDLGQFVGWARLDYDARALVDARAQLQRSVRRALWPALLGLLAALGLYCALLLRQLGRSRPLPRWLCGERNMLAGGAALALGLSLLWVGWQVNVAGQASIVPAQRVKAEAVARSSAALVARALSLGVPADALTGVPEHARALRARSPEIAAMAVLDADGKRLGGIALPAGLPQVTVPVPQQAGTAPVLSVALALDPRVLTRKLQGTLLDVAFLGAICLLLAMEWVALGLGARGARALRVAEAWQRRRTGGPRLGWRASGAVAVRPALFLFMLSEELTRPFLPTWARELAPTGAAFTPELLASVPLVVFLALVALLQWPMASWSQVFGRRRGLVLGALLGALSLAVAAAVPDYPTLVAARVLGAVGFAMVFVSAQGTVIDGSSAQDRARSLGQFVRAILVAALCGPPLGGLVADHFGVPVAFALAAVVAVLAGLAALWHMPATPKAPELAAPARPGRSTGTRGVLRQSGLWPLLLGCAMPAKLLLAAFCFYLLPMHLQDSGHGSATIGRLQTIYPLAMVLLVPLAAHLADRWRRRHAFVVLGGLLAGGSAWLAWPVAQAPLLLAGVLLLFGIGQALSITPQSALVADQARRHPGAGEAAVLGLFRVTERSGSALGPALGAWLLPWLGFGPALALIGTSVVLGSAAYGLVAHLRRAGCLRQPA